MSLEVAGKLLGRPKRTRLRWRDTMEGRWEGSLSPGHSPRVDFTEQLGMLTGRNRDAQCGRSNRVPVSTEPMFAHLRLYPKCAPRAIPRVRAPAQLGLTTPTAGRPLPPRSCGGRPWAFPPSMDKEQTSEASGARAHLMGHPENGARTKPHLSSARVQCQLGCGREGAATLWGSALRRLF